MTSNQDDPDFRATIVRGRLTLVAWHPGLMRLGGPAEQQFRQRARSGVAVADLHVLDDEDPKEVAVQLLSGTLGSAERRALVEWAGLLGYARVWMPDELVEPEFAAEAVGGLVGTRCPSCRSRWENEAWDFWEMVRGWGFFPLSCPLCGADLPQWTVSSR